MSPTKIALNTAVLVLVLTGTSAFGSDRDLFISGPKDTNPNFQDREPWNERGANMLPPWPKNELKFIPPPML